MQLKEEKATNDDISLLHHHILLYVHLIMILLQGRGVSRGPPLGFIPLQGSESTGHHPQPIGARQSG